MGKLVSLLTFCKEPFLPLADTALALQLECEWVDHDIVHSMPVAKFESLGCPKNATHMIPDCILNLHSAPGFPSNPSLNSPDVIESLLTD
jgi:hypothetical protein